MKERKLEIYLFFILLAVAVYLTFSIFLPYLSALMLALVFAVVFDPLYKFLLSKMPGYRSVASILTLILFVTIILVPIIFYGAALSDEVKNLYDRFFNDPTSESLLIQVTNLGNGLMSYFSPFGYSAPVFDVSQTEGYILSFLSWLRGHFGGIFSGLAKFFVNIFLFLVSFYYLLRDGEHLRKTVVFISPFQDSRDEEILHKLKSAIMSVVKGSILVALIQGLLTGLGFFIFGIPSALLWGGVASIAALIPGIGTSLVIVPGIIYLLFAGTTTNALGLLIWGVLAVGLIDNFLGPKLVGRGIKIHPLLILFAALGGIGYFGPLGFIFGPLIVSFLFALIDIYKTILVREVK